MMNSKFQSEDYYIAMTISGAELDGSSLYEVVKFLDQFNRLYTVIRIATDPRYDHVNLSSPGYRLRAQDRMLVGKLSFGSPFSVTTFIASSAGLATAIAAIGRFIIDMKNRQLDARRKTLDNRKAELDVIKIENDIKNLPLDNEKKELDNFLHKLEILDKVNGLRRDGLAFGTDSLWEMPTLTRAAEGVAYLDIERKSGSDPDNGISTALSPQIGVGASNEELMARLDARGALDKVNRIVGELERSRLQVYEVDVGPPLAELQRFSETDTAQKLTGALTKLDSPSQNWGGFQSHGQGNTQKLGE